MTADRQNTPQDAPHAPVSDFQAPQAPGDGATAYDAGERAQRYADALALDLDGEHAFCASHSATGSAWSCACGEVFTDRHGHAAHLSAVRTEAVMAVADQETAEAESARLASVVAKVQALADEWATGGIPCVCGHTLDTHNGLGCYERVSYEPLVKCDCELTDDRHDGQLAAAILRTLAPDTATPGEATR